MTAHPVRLAIDLARAEEIRQAERQLADTVAGTLAYAPPGLTDEQSTRVAAFSKWAAIHGVRALPAAPATVAAFVLDQGGLKVPLDGIADTLAAVAALHDLQGLANPTSTNIVHHALANVGGGQGIVAPRSWTNEERAEFFKLPLHVQRVVSRRDGEREREIRRIQNELARMRANVPERLAS